jgi:hypothetical protein
MRPQGTWNGRCRPLSMLLRAVEVEPKASDMLTCWSLNVNGNTLLRKWEAPLLQF